MASIEYLISKMPYSITKTYKERCVCGAVHEVTQRLTLTIDTVFYTTNKNKYVRYRIYYSAGKYSIGENAGIGYSTLKQALKNLLKYKNEIRGKSMLTFNLKNWNKFTQNYTENWNYFTQNYTERMNNQC